MNERYVDLYRKLKVDCAGGNYRVFFVYDNTRGDFDASFFEDKSEWYLFDWDQLAARYDMYSVNRKGRVYDGNTTFPILLFCRDNPDYRFYWRVEYDVWYHGPWDEFFDAFEANDSDLLTTTLFRPPLRPDWEWWRTLRKPWSHWRRVDKIRCFLGVSRLSRRACETLEHAFHDGWAGHDEVAVPTILRDYGLSLEDIGGDGEFVKPGNANRFYTNTPRRSLLAPGTFVCPPRVPESLDQPGKLYHPVK
ncbi:MAG: hypothetical protein WBK96_06685 [Candidatus Manganitrophaceae bacterium]